MNPIPPIDNRRYRDEVAFVRRDPGAVGDSSNWAIMLF